MSDGLLLTAAAAQHCGLSAQLFARSEHLCIPFIFKQFEHQFRSLLVQSASRSLLLLSLFPIRHAPITSLPLLDHYHLVALFALSFRSCGQFHDTEGVPFIEKSCERD